LIRGSSSTPRAACRAAYELASLIQNDPKLAGDPKLLGELTDLLEHELDSVENTEMTQYVALALGRFQTLDAVSSSGQKIDVVSALVRALDAKDPSEVRIAAAMSLAKHAARLRGKLDDPRAIAALSAAAATGEPAPRQMAVFALGFFGGDDTVKALRDRLNDEDRYVRYNAAIALGRRGDTAPLATFREMLDPVGLDKVIEIESASEKRAKIESIGLEALGALETSISAGHADLARSLRPEIESLSRSGLASVRTRAHSILLHLPK
jgi:HEAT repeat protein